MGEKKQSSRSISWPLTSIKKNDVKLELAMASINNKAFKPMLSQTTDVILDQNKLFKIVPLQAFFLWLLFRKHFKCWTLNICLCNKVTDKVFLCTTFVLSN
jgi:hypothetical protein